MPLNKETKPILTMFSVILENLSTSQIWNRMPPTKIKRKTFSSVLFKNSYATMI